MAPAGVGRRLDSSSTERPGRRVIGPWRIRATAAQGGNPRPAFGWLYFGLAGELKARAMSGLQRPSPPRHRRCGFIMEGKAAYTVCGQGSQGLEFSRAGDFVISRPNGTFGTTTGVGSRTAGRDVWGRDWTRNALAGQTSSIANFYAGHSRPACRSSKTIASTDTRISLWAGQGRCTAGGEGLEQAVITVLQVRLGPDLETLGEPPRHGATDGRLTGRGIMMQLRQSGGDRRPGGLKGRLAPTIHGCCGGGRGAPKGAPPHRLDRLPPRQRQAHFDHSPASAYGLEARRNLRRAVMGWHEHACFRGGRDAVLVSRSHVPSIGGGSASSAKRRLPQRGGHQKANPLTMDPFVSIAAIFEPSCRATAGPRFRGRDPRRWGSTPGAIRILRGTRLSPGDGRADVRARFRRAI